VSGTNSGNWKKGPGGGWIPTQAPAVPPRRQAPPVPPRPAQPPMPVSPLNAAFLANPLLFIRKHSCSPPDNYESFGTEISRVTPLAGEILSGGQGSSTGGDVVRNNVKSLIRFVRLKPHPKPDFPNTMTLDLKKMREAPNDDRIPIYWLPWFSLRIMEITIPPVPSNLVDPDDDEYPRFFFTAGINGCSVFAKGESTNPTIFHAGITGNLGRGAPQFWRDQMANTGTGFGASTVRAEVNRDDYMFSKPEDSDLARKYLAWLSQASPASKPFAINVGSSFGCVFGIRFGRHWSLYLQESMMVSTVRFHKKSDVAKTKTGNNVSYQVNGSLTRAEPFQRKGAVFSKIVVPPGKKEVFSSKSTTPLPLRVSEIYPTRTWTKELLQTFVEHAG
jgi:hypothetical protein